MLNPSALAPGQEQFENYISRVTGRRMVQYIYRHEAGRLFSCVACTLMQARRKRDRWFETHALIRRAGAKRASVVKRLEGMSVGLRALGIE